MTGGAEPVRANCQVVMTLFYHVFGDRCDRHVQPVVKMPIDGIEVISLRVLSDRLDFEKLLQHFSKGYVAESIDAVAGPGIVSVGDFSKHDTSLPPCRVETHLTAFANRDAPIDSSNPFLEYERFGLPSCSNSETWQVFVSIESLPISRRLDFHFDKFFCQFWHNCAVLSIVGDGYATDGA